MTTANISLAISSVKAKGPGFLMRPCDWIVLTMIGLVILLVESTLWRGQKLVLGTEINDFFLFVDFTHRWDSGQIPHIDYRTPLGFLTTGLPFVGYKLTSDYALGMLLANFFGLCLVAPAFVYAARSRLSNGQTLIMALCLCVLSLTPMDMLDATFLPSGGMFYNRLGWGLVMVAALFVAERRRMRGAIGDYLDLGFLAYLAVIGVFLKISFGLGIVLLAAIYLCLQRPNWRAIAAGIGVGLIGWGMVELKLHITQGYLADLQFIARLDDGGRLQASHFLFLTIDNLADLLLGVILPLAILAGIGMLNFRHGITLLAIAGIGVLMIVENAQTIRIPLFIVVALLVGNIIADQVNLPRLKLLTLCLPLAASAPLLEEAMQCSLQLFRLSKPEASVAVDLPGLTHLYLKVDGDPDLVTATAAGRISGKSYLEKAARLPATGFQTMRQQDIVGNLKQAIALVPQCKLSKGSVLMADFTNPLPAFAGLAPAGREPLWHVQRSFTQDQLPEASAAFANTDCIMVPVQPMNPQASDLLMSSYAKQIKADYPTLIETPLWRIYRKAP